MSAARLFQILDTHTKKALPNRFFTNKLAAKLERQELNTAAGVLRFIVTPGPDHHNYKG